MSQNKRSLFKYDKSSSVKLNNFGVSQESILGPVLFNLYVVDFVENVICDSLQYANDSTVYKHSQLKNLKKCIEELVSLWSSNNIKFSMTIKLS